MTNKQEEKKEQSKTVNWAREHGFKVWVTANGQFLNTWSAINARGNMGKGLSDLVIILPAEYSKSGSTQLYFLEMKRVKGGRVSPQQKEFILLANSVKGNCFAHVANGFIEAKAYLEQFLKEREPMSDDEVNDLIKNL